MKLVTEPGVQIEILHVQPANRGVGANQTIETLHLLRRDRLVAERCQQFGDGSIVWTSWLAGSLVGSPMDAVQKRLPDASQTFVKLSRLDAAIFGDFPNRNSSDRSAVAAAAGRRRQVSRRTAATSRRGRRPRRRTRRDRRPARPPPRRSRRPRADAAGLGTCETSGPETRRIGPPRA